MILIHDIEVMVVPDDVWERYELELPKSVWDPEVRVDDLIIREMILGRKYINAYGQKVCIGMTKKIQESIGLPFEAFKNLEDKYERIGNLNIEYAKLNTIHKSNALRLKGLNWWGRLKLVFYGYKNIL